MRLVGIILILFGFVLCLTIIGIIPGMLLIVVGGVLTAVGGRRKVVINNTITVANTAPAEPRYQPDLRPPLREPLRELPAVRTSALAAPEDTYDRKKWQTLVRYDDDLRAAAEKVRILGGVWEDELAEEYLKINDKTYLPKIVERIVADAEKNR